MASAVEARRELGDELEPAVVDAFLERVERAVEERAKAQRKPRQSFNSGERLALTIVSISCGIPITAIAAEEGVVGIVVAWCGIVGVNLANALRRDG